MSALLRCFTLLLLLFTAQTQAAGLPGLLGGSAPAQPQASEPLGKSLDEVITTLENDQQRTRLLNDLKKLRDSTRQAQPEPEQGVLGLIGGALHDFEKQFSGDASPFLQQVWDEARAADGTHHPRHQSLHIITSSHHHIITSSLTPVIVYHYK